MDDLNSVLSRIKAQTTQQPAQALTTTPEEAERIRSMTAILVRKQSRLTGDLAGMTFAALKRVEALREALTVAKDTVKRYPGIDHGYILEGPCGCGKTHILAATVHKLIEQGYQSEFWTSEDFLNGIRAGYNSTDHADPTPHLCKVRILALDEIGGENINGKNAEWVQSQLLTLINSRCTHRVSGRLTLMTTNLTQDELRARIGPRSLDRILEMCEWVTIKAPSYRATIQRQHKESRLKTDAERGEG
jgi:DNA replication protein DnaC